MNDVVSRQGMAWIGKTPDSLVFFFISTRKNTMSNDVPGITTVYEKPAPETWECTGELRFYSRCEDELGIDRTETYQQKWRSSNGVEEWRDIERVFE